MALIKCDGISIAYEGQTVVRDLSFWIEQGDYLCIVGENGSGKSTLVKSLLGLKPPFKGQILLKPENLFRRSNFLRTLKRSPILETKRSTVFTAKRPERSVPI